MTKLPWLNPYHVPQLNDILFNEINTCKKNDNFMFAQVSTQCPFTCVTSIFGERKWDLVCHIQKLASYHPCMVSFVRIIYPMGDIGVRGQCGFLNIHFHNVFHNHMFYEPAFFHFNHVHVVSYSHCCESPHWLINPSTLKPFCFQRKPAFQCPMVRLNLCLCILVWMWHLLKFHNPQIYKCNVHPQIFV